MTWPRPLTHVAPVLRRPQGAGRRAPKPWAVAALACAVCLGLGSAASAHLATLRCGRRIVTEGATTHRVRALCGEPAAISRERSLRLTRRIAPVPCRPGAQTRCTQTVTELAEVTIEHWTYDRGPRALVQQATFEADRLIAVRPAGFGTRR